MAIQSYFFNHIYQSVISSSLSSEQPKISKETSTFLKRVKGFEQEEKQTLNITTTSPSPANDKITQHTVSTIMTTPSPFPQPSSHSIKQNRNLHFKAFDPYLVDSLGKDTILKLPEVRACHIDLADLKKIRFPKKIDFSELNEHSAGRGITISGEPFIFIKITKESINQVKNLYTVLVYKDLITELYTAVQFKINREAAPLEQGNCQSFFCDSLGQLTRDDFSKISRLLKGEIVDDKMMTLQKL